MRQVVTERVRFWRDKTRHPWTCATCGAEVRDTTRHAQWHASLNGVELAPPDPTRRPESLVVLIGENGWPIQ